MKAAVTGLISPPILLGALGLCLAAALAAGQVGEVLDMLGQIEAARERLARARHAAERPQPPAPLVAADTEGLLSAFRSRLESLAAERAAVLDQTEIVPDPERASLPRLRAVLRGTAEGVHGLMHALEAQAPLLAVEEADVTIQRPADAETGRPGVLRIALTTRGLVLQSSKPGQGTSP